MSEKLGMGAVQALVKSAVNGGLKPGQGVLLGQIASELLKANSDLAVENDALAFQCSTVGMIAGRLKAALAKVCVAHIANPGCSCNLCQAVTEYRRLFPGEDALESQRSPEVGKDLARKMGNVPGSSPGEQSQASMPRTTK